jgi:hypothetical protein
MSTVLTGSAGNITTPLQASITALSNNGSGAVRATTASPHLFGTNDRVYVNTSPTIGFFLITVIDATHFDLVNSTFVSTSVGYATDYGLTPQVQVPTDGDTFSAQLSGLLSCVQSILDRTQYLQQQAIVTKDPPPFYGSINLYPQFQSTVGNQYGASNWDPVNLKWLVTSINSGTQFQTVVSSRDIDGSNWPGIAGAGSIGLGGGTAITGVVRQDDSSVSSKYVIVGVTHSGSAQIFRCDTTVGTTWSHANTFGGLGTAEQVVLTCTPGTTIAAIAGTVGGSTGVCGLYTSGDDGVSWGVTHTLQTDFWLLKPRTSNVNNRRAIAIPCLSATSTSGNLLWWDHNYAALHSVTVTAGSQSSLISGAETPTALTYCTDVSGSGQWLLSTWTGSQTNLYAASDSATLTWHSLSNSIGMSGFNIDDMAAIGSMVVAVADDGGPFRIACSPDGGVSWNQCAASVKSAAGTLSVSASQNQFLVQGPISITPSLTYGDAHGIGPL